MPTDGDKPMNAGPLLRREEGETITARAERDVNLLAGDDALSITWSRYAGGERGPDLHVHREHTDAFYVLEGELTFGLGPAGDPLRMTAGGFVAVPPGIVHSFANESGTDAAWLNFHAPDKGFAAYLRAARDGRDAAFDSFDPPAGGGGPVGSAVVSGPGDGEHVTVGGAAVRVKCRLPELTVVEWPMAPGPRPGVRCYGLDGSGRTLAVHPSAAPFPP
jgi:quercetin dioxygenase-like cupin family protein